MNEKCLGSAQLEELFSVVLYVDDAARIVHASDTARRYIPDLTGPRGFFDTFKLLRPNGTKDLATLRKHRSSLFLMKTHDDQFAVRGQFVDAHWEDQEVLCFCGAPWLFWMNSNCPDIKLGMGDFSPQDSQLDQLFLMTTEQRMVNDLEKLNADLKHAKQETEAIQETKNAMFARMSHEMRTPLNGVVSALSLLSDRRLDDDSRHLLTLAHSSSRNLLHVINYVLDISKLESGDDGLESVLFDTSALLKSVVDIVSARAVERGLELLWRKSPQLSDSYLGDKAKLRQCLLNLVTNAIKFTPQGTIVVRALPSLRGSGGYVRFEVEDTGMGIEAQKQNAIFEPFWTDPNVVPAGEKGTGLGLDIVRRNIEAMHGEIGVISREGKGSLFWFEVPLEASEETIDETSGVPGVFSTATRFDGRVLLVDDNETNIMLGRMILESLGVTVDEAHDGGHAAEKSLNEDYDLVLMDISMPVMDGVDATRRIRKRRGPGELPIVALTAFASSEEKERCLEAGMNDYLTKPIVRDRLAEQLGRWLQSSDDGDTPDAGNQTSASGPAKEEPPRLARSVLEELREQIGDANLGTVLDQFEGEVRNRWDALAAAFDERDTDALARESHTLASTCRSLGLIAAGEHFSTLEDGLRAGDAAPDSLASTHEIITGGLSALREFRSEK